MEQLGQLCDLCFELLIAFLQLRLKEASLLCFNLDLVLQTFSFLQGVQRGLLRRNLSLGLDYLFPQRLVRLLQPFNLKASSVVHRWLLTLVQLRLNLRDTDVRLGQTPLVELLFFSVCNGLLEEVLEARYDLLLLFESNTVGLLATVLLCESCVLLCQRGTLGFAALQLLVNVRLAVELSERGLQFLFELVVSKQF